MQASRWARVPGMPVVERIERVGAVERLWVSIAPFNKPFYWAIVHHVDGVVIDTGPSRAREAVKRFIEHRPVRTVLTTHLHEDHVGNHETLPQDVEVYAPEGTLPILREGPPRLPLYRWFTWGTHGAAPRASVLGERVVTEKRTFRVVPTPGHSEDHVSFLDEADQVVFTGDAFLGKPRAARLEEDVHTEVASLRRLADLDAATLMSAHAPPFHKPRAKLLETADWYDDLARRAWRLHDKGMSARRIRKELLGREPTITWMSAREFSCDHMVTNLLRRRP